jgi:hypothetical protein
VTDRDLGVEVRWNLDFYSGQVHPSIQIFEGTIANPPPPPSPAGLDALVVSDITLRASKRNVSAKISVVDEDGASIAGAAVSIRWQFPNGAQQTFNGTTNNRGVAFFEVGTSRGTHTVSILSVEKDGYSFDENASALTESVQAKR